MTPTGIEPATFRFVNHWATAVLVSLKEIVFIHSTDIPSAVLVTGKLILQHLWLHLQCSFTYQIILASYKWNKATISRTWLVFYTLSLEITSPYFNYSHILKLHSNFFFQDVYLSLKVHVKAAFGTLFAYFIGHLITDRCLRRLKSFCLLTDNFRLF